MAMGQTEQAEKIYSHIYQKKKFSPGLRAEAAMILNRPAEAQQILQKALQATPDQTELLFLAAVVEYQLGRIQHVSSHLREAIENGLDWEDEDPITLVVEHCLSSAEFLDLEEIYLDCEDELFSGIANAKNRWFGLNMSVYELYTATTPEKRNKRAGELMQLLNAREGLAFEEGSQQLEKILSDFSKNEQDARFGLEGLKLFYEGKYDQIARMVLAMQLEHLKEFGVLLALPVQLASDSSLQQLVIRLPMRIAIGLLTLYTIATSADRLSQLMKQDIEPAILATLISTCFSSFYTEINYYKNRQQPT